jgi:hypothetical protein
MPGMMRARMARGCGNADPALVRCTGATFKALLTRAYWSYSLSPR